MSSALGFTFSFEPGTLTGSEIAAIVEETDFVFPAFVNLDDAIPLGTKFEPGHLAQIASARRPEYVILAFTENMSHDEGPYLSLTNVKRFQGLYLQTTNAAAIPPEVLLRLVCRKGFRAGACHPSEDTFWQEEESTDTFESLGRPHEHLPRLWDDDFNEWKIDISRNPARRHGIADMWLQAAWRMWFGEEAFKHIAKELLLSFPGAQEIKELACGTVFIQLFDDPFAYDQPENRRRQQAFLDYVHMDAVIEKANSEIYGDCHFEDHEGNFEYGGTLRSFRWTDDTGKTVLRSRATQVEICEVSADNRLLKRWFEPAARYREAAGDPPEGELGSSLDN